MPGGWEWIIILVVALLLFGGSRLAGLGKGVGASRPDSLRAPRDHGPPAAQIEFLQIHCLAPCPAMPRTASCRTRPWPPR